MRLTRPHTTPQRARVAASHRAGFSLVELLVAMGVFGVVMAGITLLFVSSVRSVKQGTQNIDAFSTARNTFNVVERDLTTAFTARERGDYYSFFGSPIGFTFIGVVNTRAYSGDVNRYDNLARITYVLHVSDGNIESGGVRSNSFNPDNPAANVVKTAGSPVKTFALIRYVEPGVSNLDDFPVNWNARAYSTDNPNPETLADYANNLIPAVSLTGLDGNQANAVVDELRKASRRETWIRLLSGEVGRAWNLPGQTNTGLLNKFAADYVISDGIILEDGAPGGAILPTWSQNYSAVAPLFTYGGLSQAETNSPLAPYWNAPWNLFTNNVITQDTLTALGSMVKPRIPALVGVRLQWMFPSPYPGAPDFKRAFDQKIDIPTGYTRQDLTKKS